ncbi:MULTISPECIES: TIGR03943 family putative permease subunit [Paenibacillus]|uniref:TIGR03943 family putative permease subunit n=1 Tax=Paenibacillus TaxID=44249 RepID=UPI0022B9229B|nr:TIGR03943 family protein [Paenibacillus caseinilyticus]MCZ8522768.1 TIGR03943 family protein [Paenibacillus caseinilyticus]
MNPRILSLHHVLKALILLGFAVYIAYLAKTDLILLYIAPRMVDYVKWSALVLYAVAAHQLLLAVRTFRSGTAADCGCGHDHAPSRSLFKNAVVYGLFCLPLGLGFLLPDASMGSSLAAKKGMNLSSASVVKESRSGSEGMGPLASAQGTQPPAPDGSRNASAPGDSPSGSAAAAETLFPADKFTEHYAKQAKELYRQEVITVREDLFMETLTTLDLYLDQFVGKKLQLTGFVYRQDEMSPKQFVVGRFSIQCCSADAAPFGVLAEYDRAAALETDSWVTVTGTIGKTEFGGMEIMRLQIDQVAKAQPAKTPYVYPNAEFGS